MLELLLPPLKQLEEMHLHNRWVSDVPATILNLKGLKVCL